MTAFVHNASGAYAAAVAVRLNLSELSQRGGIGVSWFSDTISGITPTAGIQNLMSTMYFAEHKDTATLRVFAWPETGSSYSWVDVPHHSYIQGPGQCSGPDGTNMCGYEDGAIKGGWSANGVLGFMWDSAQGQDRLGNFAYPYTDVVEINQSSMALIDEPVIYNPSYAFWFSSVAANNRGGLGLSIAYGLSLIHI